MINRIFNAGYIYMYHKARLFLPVFLFFVCLIAVSVHAEGTDTTCNAEDQVCILDTLVDNAALIEKSSHQDQAYREAAATYALGNEFEKAISLVGKISNPDTQAAAIHGIGKAIATHDFSPEGRVAMFVRLHKEAKKIEHPASLAIALTNIAVTQALSHDNDGAWSTVSHIENEILRHKAYSALAETQASTKDFEAARMSIEKIENLDSRNETFSSVARILADHSAYEDSYKAARAITDPYKKVQSLQYLLNAQNSSDINK